MTELTRKSWLAMSRLVAGMAALLFVPPWSLRYWQAWVYLALLAGCSAVVAVYLQRHNPELLRRRLAAKPKTEKSRGQKLVHALFRLAFPAFLVVSSLDHRWGWSDVPLGVVLLGDVLAVTGYGIVFWTFRVNSFASATIETVEEQQVTSTGPYAVVRHPMYAGTQLTLLGTPLALGSFWGLVVLVPELAVIVWRLLDEERFLARELPGYAAYSERVRYRLLPGIW